MNETNEITITKTDSLLYNFLEESFKNGNISVNEDATNDELDEFDMENNFENLKINKLLKKKSSIEDFLLWLDNNLEELNIKQSELSKTNKVSVNEAFEMVEIDQVEAFNEIKLKSDTDTPNSAQDNGVKANIENKVNNETIDEDDLTEPDCPNGLNMCKSYLNSLVLSTNEKLINYSSQIYEKYYLNCDTTIKPIVNKIKNAVSNEINQIKDKNCFIKSINTHVNTKLPTIFNALKKSSISIKNSFSNFKFNQQNCDND